MLKKVSDLKGYKLHASDGLIGKVKDFYFDDQHWTVRYLVADTGSWLSERQVLLSPYALNYINDVEKSIVISLSKNTIKDSPSAAQDTSALYRH